MSASGVHLHNPHEKNQYHYMRQTRKYYRFCHANIVKIYAHNNRIVFLLLLLKIDLESIYRCRKLILHQRLVVAVIERSPKEADALSAGSSIIIKKKLSNWDFLSTSIYSFCV